MSSWFKGKGRRLVSLLLTAVMVVGLLPGALPVAFAADAGSHPVLQELNSKFTNGSTYDSQTGKYATSKVAGYGGQNPIIWKASDIDSFSEGTVTLKYKDDGISSHQSSFGIFLYNSSSVHDGDKAKADIKYLYIGYDYKGGDTGNGDNGWFWQARYQNGESIAGAFISPKADTEGHAPTVGGDAVTLSLTVKDNEVTVDANGTQLTSDMTGWKKDQNTTPSSVLPKIDFDTVGVGTVTVGFNGANVTIESIEVTKDELEPGPGAGPWSGNAQKASGDANAFSNATDKFATEVIKKWDNIPIWTVDGTTDWAAGSVTLTYIDHGVGDGDEKRPSDFGVVLKYSGSGGGSDKYLYVGYNGNKTDNAGTNGTAQGWFWQYRLGSTGEFLGSPLVNGVTPSIDGAPTTISVTTKGSTVTVSVNGQELVADNWDVEGGNKKGTLSSLLSSLPSGKVGFGMVTAGTDGGAKANVTVQDFAVTAAEPELEPQGDFDGLKITTVGQNHIHVKLLQFGATGTEIQTAKAEDDNLSEGYASGTYEINFRTTDKIPSNLGFLVRFRAENDFLGVSFTGSGAWETHDTTDSGRDNKSEGIAGSAPKLETNHAYTIRITYGEENSNRVKVELKDNTAGGSDFQKVGEWDADNSTYSTNAKKGQPGGLAIRINKYGADNGDSVILESIKHTSTEGKAVTADYQHGFTDVSDIAWVSYANAGGTVGSPNQTLATLELVKLKDVVTKEALQAAIQKAEELNKDAYTQESWQKLEDAKTKAKQVEQKAEATQDEVNQATQALLAAIDDLEKKQMPEDPGLGEWTPDVEVDKDKLDTYDQSMNGTGASTLGNGTLVNVNQDYWGMSGKALVLTNSTSSDARIRFEELKETGPANGKYTLTIRTGENDLPASLAFLVRYKDEYNYVGFSFDSAGIVAHYAMGDTGTNAKRTNDTLNEDVHLEPNSIYKITITYTGKNMELELQKEGEDTRSFKYELKEGGTLSAGTFAIRFNGAYSLTIDNVTQYDADGKILAKLDYNGSDPVASNYPYRTNRSANDNGNATVSTWAVPESEIAPSYPAGKATKLTANGEKVFVDEASPNTVPLAFSAQIYADWAKAGLVFAYQNENNYLTIRRSGGNWVLGGKKAGTSIGTVTFSGADLAGDYAIPAGTADTRTLRVDLTKINRETGAGTVKLTVSAGKMGTVGDTGEFTAQVDAGTNSDIAALLKGRGRVGVLASGKMDLFLVGQIHVSFLLEVVDVEPPKDSVQIKSDKMTVWVDKDAPFIYRYETTDHKVAYGSMTEKRPENFSVTLNGTPAVVTTTPGVVSSNKDSITYKVHAMLTSEADAPAVDFTVRFQVKENRLVMTVIGVDVTQGTLRTFEFPGMEMLSFAGLGAKAAIGRVNGWGPATDEFVSPNGAAADTTYGNRKNANGSYIDGITYLLLSDRASASVGAIENNVEAPERKYNLSLKVAGVADPYLTVTNTAWSWQYYANTPLPTSEKETDMYYDRLPFATVVIGGDENKDGNITWQDAGVAYRTIMNRAYGSENTKNEWMYIAMNMSSQASQPFLRVLDTAKAISYLTDGFGFKIMNKGYQGAGHDDSHGDYDFVGLQQGGAEDFNHLIDVGLLYGVKNGVHMNVTEFALDSTGAKWNGDSDTNMTITASGGMQGAWKWFDKAYAVNKSVDVSSGFLKDRVETAFGSDGTVGENGVIPKLDFVYVDVYQSGSNYNATAFLKYLNDAGLTVGTEALGDFDQGITFVHWNTDLYYKNGGEQSEIMRFVIQGQGDLNAPDKALLGAVMPDLGDWSNTNNFGRLIPSFYRNNLPTKYLQHFNLIQWESGVSAKLEGFGHTITSEVSGKYTTIKEDGKVIAVIDTSKISPYATMKQAAPTLPDAAAVFIPWSPETEDKIYYYADASMGGSGVWDLPDSWKSVGTVYVYELTVNGRTGAAKAINVTDGKVDLSSLSKGTPYIVLKTATKTVTMYDANGKPNGKTLPTLAQHPYGEFTGIKDPGFTSGSLGEWKFTPAAEGDSASIVSGIITDGEGHTANQGDGDPRVAITGGGTLSQQITVQGGKTYTFSVWAYSAGEITLTVKSGASVLKTVTLPTTDSNYQILFKPSKFVKTNWQRLRLEGVVIPANVTSVTLELTVDGNGKTAYVDDFRSWVWNGMDTQTVNPEAEKYYYFEDFENLDENWGPFVSAYEAQPHVNLVYRMKDPQIKCFTIDGRVSLKDQSTGSGDRMRTIPSTLTFEKGYTYTVSFDYQSYYEMVANKTVGSTTYPAGYHAPLEQRAYAILVKDAAGNTLKTIDLAPSKLKAGQTAGFKAEFETNTCTFTVDARGKDNIYLALNKKVNDSPDILCVIDNFKVTVNTVFAGLDKVNDQKTTLTVRNADPDMWYYLVDDVTQNVVAAEEVPTQAAKISLFTLLGLKSADESSAERTNETTVVFNNLEPDHDYTVKAIAVKKLTAEEVTPPKVDESDKAVQDHVDIIAPARTPSSASAQSADKGENTDGGKLTVTATRSSIKVGPVIEGSEYTLMDPVSGEIVSQWVGVDKAAEGYIEFTDLPAGKTYSVIVRDAAAGGKTASAPMELGETSIPAAEPEPDPVVPPTPSTPSTPSTPGGTNPSAKFIDVNQKGWYIDSINYVLKKGLMKGVSDTEFAPEDDLTRAELVTVLHRLAGEPVAAAASFTDVKDEWFADAVAWAAAKEIVTGYGNGKFGPDDPVTREQAAAILYRYAQYKKYDITVTGSLDGYTDAGKINDWAVDAMKWCNSHGIITGETATTLAPRGTATRAEVATILERFCKNIVK